MRCLIIVAGAALALAGCGKNDQSDNLQNIDDNLSAENIVSNDVTAIDAVTGDSANMAADVDLNFGGLDENGAATSNQGAPRPTRREPAGPSAANATNSTANATANAE